MVTRSEDRPRIRQEAVIRVSETMARSAAASDRPLAEILEESIFWERKRLARDRNGPNRGKDSDFWGVLKTKLRSTPEHQHRALLREAVEHYVTEIEGNFDPRIYTAVTRAIPPALGLVLNAVSPRKVFQNLPHLPNLDDSITIVGATDHLARLRERGTVLLVPTHASHMDSIIMGYVLFRLGHPPFLYGAGLNLFTNPFTGFFMRNLGAYTVDRKKSDPLYKETLKEYATLTLEFGYHSLFFPGGTRSRSGALERRLKLGLLSTGLRAYVHNLQRRAAKPKIYIVPAAISYQLVLEAESLVTDFLRESGQSLYTEDEFDQPGQVFRFLSKLVGLDSKIHVGFGRGLDPFGNPVDDDGESLDPKGRTIDIARYTWVDGVPTPSLERDGEFTREAADQICQSMTRENVAESTHVVARAILDLLRDRNPSMGVFQLIRTRGDDDAIPVAEVRRRIDEVLLELRQLAERSEIRIGPTCEQAADRVLEDGLRRFASFHTKPAASQRGDRILATDPSLLLYYQNRLEGYPMGRHRPLLTPDHRSLRPREF
jgi:glycerol-3-phosphate O-acyltransferase